MKVSGCPPIYCFLLLYCLNLIAQFDKLLPRTLKNSDRLLKTKRKEKTTDSRLRDFETNPKRFWDFEIGRKCSETHVSFSRYQSIPLLSRSARRSFALSPLIWCRIRVVPKSPFFFVNKPKWFSGRRIKELYGKVYRHTATRQEQIAKPWPVRPCESLWIFLIFLIVQSYVVSAT